jgi:hypothetical protein
MPKVFHYYNENPYKLEEEDCVCRAISLSLNLPYNATTNLLNMSAEYSNCDKLCIGCYRHLLEDIFNLTVNNVHFTETVKDVARRHPYNKVIIRIDGHLTCAVLGVIYDLWDCSDEYVDCYWIVN